MKSIASYIKRTLGELRLNTDGNTFCLTVLKNGTAFNLSLTDANLEKLFHTFDLVCANKLAVMDRSPDVWVDIPPIEPGRYWRRRKVGEGWLEHVVGDNEQRMCLIEKGRWGSADKYVPIVNDGSEWFGPLKPPV